MSPEFDLLLSVLCILKKLAPRGVLQPSLSLNQCITHSSLWSTNRGSLYRGTIHGIHISVKGSDEFNVIEDVNRLELFRVQILQ